jgi:hypothetical protein
MINTMIIIRKIVDIDNRINDNEEFNCSFPNRCIFDVERNAIGGLRVLSKNEPKMSYLEKRKQDDCYQ